MKSILVLFIAGTSIALALIFAVLQDPGYVRISVGNWLIESNLWVMITLNLLFVFSIVLFFNVKRRLYQSGKSIGSKLGLSGTKRAYNNTQKGFLSLLEGDWGRANKLLSRSATKAGKPVINYLAAAHAANKYGQVKDAESLLKKAYEDNADSSFAIGVVQAQIQLQQEKYEPCLATLLRLRKQQSNHPYVLKLLKKVYVKLEDWQHLVKLMPVLRKDAKIPETKLKKLEHIAWNKLLIQKSDELEKNHENQANTNTLANLWKKMPDHLRFETQTVKTYAEQLIRLNQQNECEVLLRKILNQHWHDELISIYGVIEGKDISSQLITAENWLKERPNNPALLLALGRLTLRNERWEKAMEYFEASKRLQTTQESHAEVCRLSLRLNQANHENMSNFDDLIQTLGLPELPLPEPNPISE